jgi:hypothetical protein
MRTARFIFAGGYLLGLALGSLGLMSGCGGSQTGQVEVDMAKEEAQRKEMQQFYGPPPSAKKTKGR